MISEQEKPVWIMVVSKAERSIISVAKYTRAAPVCSPNVIVNSASFNDMLKNSDLDNEFYGDASHEGHLPHMEQKAPYLNT